MSSSRSAWLRFSLVVLAALVLSACHSEPPDNHPGQPVTKRKLAFKAIVRTFEPMGLVVRGTNDYNKADFLASAVELQKLSREPWAYFGPDTNYPPTHARSAVWDKPLEFESAKQKFMAATDKLLEASRAGDFEAIRSAYDEVHQNCKSCHQAFRGTHSGEE